MEYQGWEVCYIRREKSRTIAKQLTVRLDLQSSPGKLLIILDQAEEIMTDPSTANEAEAELIELAVAVKAALDQGFHVLLGFRKEYLSDFEKLFAGRDYLKIYLEALQTKGVLEAIQGITLNQDAKAYYELEFADGQVPALIAQSVYVDEDSHVAPLLQMILVKMWDRVASNSPRVFDKTLLARVKTDSLLDLITGQIAAIGAVIPEKVQSGLVLDILHTFTTTRATAGTKTPAALKSQYRHIEINDVLSELKNKYLLTDNDIGAGNSLRLAHDALAPLIRELHALSALPGQKASRLLDSKQQEINSGGQTEFSRLDLAIIASGKHGMRALTESEQRAIDKDNQRITKEENEKRLLEERRQKERHREEFEKEKLGSMFFKLNTETLNGFAKDIKKGAAILITGDRLIFNSKGEPLVNELFREAKGAIGHEHTPDEDLHLIRTSNSRDQQWFVRALEGIFKNATVPDSPFLN